MGEKLACQTERFSTADLGFDNFGASHTGSVAILYRSRLILLNSDDLECR